MLVIKYAPNIFVTSFYICFFPIPPLLQDTCVEKLENNVLKCNLFHISVFIGDGMRHSFPFFFAYVFTIYVQNTHEKKFGPTENSRKKKLDL